MKTDLDVVCILENRRNFCLFSSIEPKIIRDLDSFDKEDVQKPFEVLDL